MQSSLVIATLLCLTTWMSLANADYRPGESCCVQWSKTQIPLKRIVNYTIQSEDTCRIRAVLLRTERGKTLCGNPDSVWVKRAIQKVDNDMKKLQENGQIEEGSASEVAPAAPATTAAAAASTKSKSIPQKNGRRGKGQKRKIRKGNRKQRSCA